MRPAAGRGIAGNRNLVGAPPPPQACFYGGPPHPGVCAIYGAWGGVVTPGVEVNNLTSIPPRGTPFHLEANLGHYDLSLRKEIAGIRGHLAPSSAIYGAVVGGN